MWNGPPSRIGECVICWAAQPEREFVPCGHSVLCENCAHTWREVCGQSSQLRARTRLTPLATFSAQNDGLRSHQLAAAIARGDLHSCVPGAPTLLTIRTSPRLVPVQHERRRAPNGQPVCPQCRVTVLREIFARTYPAKLLRQDEYERYGLCMVRPPRLELDAMPLRFRLLWARKTFASLVNHKVMQCTAPWLLDASFFA